MPLRDENTKIRSIDDELKRLSEELGLVINIPNIKEETDEKEETEKKSGGEQTEDKQGQQENVDSQSSTEKQESLRLCV